MHDGGRNLTVWFCPLPPQKLFEKITQQQQFLQVHTYITKFYEHALTNASTTKGE